MGLCIIEGQGGGGVSGVAINIGSGTRFDVSNFDGYENFTVSNFRISSIAISTSSGAYYAGNSTAGYGGVTANGSNSGSMTMSYDNTTGILTISGTSISSSGSAGANGNSCSSNTTLVPTVELITGGAITGLTPVSKTFSGSQNGSDLNGTYAVSGSVTATARIVNGAIQITGSGTATCLSHTFRQDEAPNGWHDTNTTATLI